MPLYRHALSADVLSNGALQALVMRRSASCDVPSASVLQPELLRFVPAMSTPDFDDRPPMSAKLTPYDERHLVTYLRLLDAAEEGADWREAVRIIFGLDPAREPDRARVVHDSHLTRARWMTETGYRHLLRPPTN